MKCIIIAGFCDKYTAANYCSGDIVDFTEERVKEILPTGYIKPIKEAEKPKRTTRAKSRKA